jgi:signal transduction histidine kinase
MKHPVGATARSFGEKLAHLLLTRSPLGWAVRGLAGVRVSVHAKLLGGFLLITLLFFAMGAVSLQMIARTSHHSRLLDQAHERVDWSREIQHALALQMNATAMSLLLRDDDAVQAILRENNRFNNTLARIETAAPPEEQELIRRIRAAQDEAMTTVADIADLVRDDKLEEALRLQLGKEYPLYQEIEALVGDVVRIEQDTMNVLRENLAAANQRALILMGTLAATSVLLALALGFVTSWSFILPVREAEAFLGRVATGDFGTSIAVPNRDEFGALAGHMNRMSAELAKLYEAQRQAARELGTLNEELARASAAKSEFLARMSHELRTPMNAILGFTEMVSDEIYGELPPYLKEPLADIQTNGRHLLRLINDVLDLSKIEAGRMELSLEDYSVQEIVETVRVSLRSLAAEKGLDLVAELPAEIPPAFGDGKRIAQCLTNLAGNALKFTRHGRVEIKVECWGAEILYRVADTGIGIPPDQLEHIFTEFRQVDATITREFGGSGLGLSITKKFVELHGGRLWVESELGRGSTFFFTVPLRVGERTA